MVLLTSGVLSPYSYSVLLYVVVCSALPYCVSVDRLRAFRAAGSVYHPGDALLRMLLWGRTGTLRDA